MTDEFFKEFLATDDIDRGLYIIFKHFNNYANDGKFEIIDEILKQVNPDELSLDISVGFLTASWPMRNHLNDRQDFVERCRPVFILKAGPKRAKRLLWGLESS